jgi:predicted nucleotide-binding protein (sugar kinase/HSP70/actin superfamily)
LTEPSTPTITSTSEEQQAIKQFKIGIPRGLFFFKFFPLWKAFLEYLQCEVVVSPATNSKIVEEGAKAALSELCVPMKIFYGHVLALLREYPDIDYIFIPRYASVHNDKWYCPKFMILPEAIKYGLRLQKPIITLEVNAKEIKGIEGAINFGKQLGFSEEQSGKAWYFAFEKYQKAREQARKGDWLEILNQLDTDSSHSRKKTIIKTKIPEMLQGKFPINILLLGHAYNVYETYINLDMEARLKAFDAQILTMELLPEEVYEKPITINQHYNNYWENEEEILQTARYFLLEAKDQVDGVIFLISFACGPDSLIQELVMRDMKKMKIPFLELVLDEHSGEGGLVTRIESFVDMVRREKYGNLI